jgi:ribose transport system permease protein
MTALRAGRAGRSFSLGLDRFSGLYIWAAFIVIFAIWIPQYFLASATVHSIASSQAVPAIVAIAVLIPLAAGAYDLSVGSMTNFCAILVIVLQLNYHMNMWLALVLSIAAGVLMGVVNGFLVVRLHIDSFIATLGTSVVILALQGVISAENQPPSVTSQAWANLTQSTVGGFQIVIVYLIVVAFVVWWALEHTPAGRYIYAIGGNREAARLSGVNVGKWEWVTLASSGGLCGLAGVLYGSQSGPSLTFGTGLLLPAFAAVFLGSTQIRAGRVNLWGTMLAVFLLATGVTGLQLVTGVQWLNDMFSGVALILAVGFAVWRQRHSGAGRARAAVTGPDDDQPASEAGAVPPPGQDRAHHTAADSPL